MNLSPKRIAYLIHKYLLDDISPAEMELLWKWRTERLENEQYFQRMCTANEQGELHGLEGNTDRVWQSVDQMMHAPQRKVMPQHWIAYGGISFVIVALASIVYFSGKDASRKEQHPDVVWKQVSTAAGERKMVVLPDSSVVWLNGDSWIKYPSFFLDTARIVAVEGEAFFDVRKILSSHGEFVTMKVDVMCDTSKVERVEVTGTRFNIHARSSGEAVHTTLFEGMITVIQGRFAKAIRPGQQSIVRISGPGPIEVMDRIDTAAILGWREGYLQFEDADVATVLHELESRFGYTFKVQRRVRGEITARFDSSYSVKQICNFISQITDAKFTFKDSTIFVR